VPTPGLAVSHHGTAVLSRNGAAVGVLDDAPPGQAGGFAVGLPGAGHGIIGMRERVSLLGGEFSAGPLPGYGFRVSARIPLSSSS
jgi:glucose-6-phosphate-specific signal transduction histidine kinase